MERDIWKWITAALRRLPPTRPRNASYTDPDILAVALWAVLHDRPVAWACRRESWPMQAWRRDLPDQSCVSRRTRTFGFARALLRLVERLQPKLPPAPLAFLDAKGIMLGEYTADPCARLGRGARRFGKGYKLFVLADADGRVLAWTLGGMNDAECVASRRLLIRARRKGVLAGRAVVVADAAYDSNPLQEAAMSVGVRLIAPRRKPKTGKGWRRQTRGRLVSIRVTEHRPALWRKLRAARASVERFFGMLSWRGLFAPPPWVRRRHRVAIWTACKLVILAAARTARAHAKALAHTERRPIAA